MPSNATMRKSSKGTQRSAQESTQRSTQRSNLESAKDVKKTAAADAPRNVNATKGNPIFKLVFLVLGIYVSFLSWAVLQERISTTPYGADNLIFKSAHTIGAIQSLFACITGLLFLKFTNPKAEIVPKNPAVIQKYLLVAACQTLSSPFSYASLQYVDYVTMLLAKSCKLVPVMAVHVLLYSTKFPSYKYAVVLAVTLGVSIFSLYGQKFESTSSNIGYGLFLLGCGLFLDGLYNTTQDKMFQNHKSEVSGPHMMAVLNFFTFLMSTASAYTQRNEVMYFVRNHPQVFKDIALFALCGSIGQVFIFLTLENFGSLVLVTTTVTRKMMSMLLSVVWFKHKLSYMQWVGIALVFGGILSEAVYKFIKK